MEMPGAHWFCGATLNYAEHALRFTSGNDETAILFKAEAAGGRTHHEEISRSELKRQVAFVAAGLRAMGVKRGDRVAGYLSNTPETLVAFLASASIGAIWSNCAVEMTGRSVLDRLAQIEPKVLFASCGYWYGGRKHDRGQAVEEIVAELPGLQNLVLVSQMVASGGESPSVRPETICHRWEDLLNSTEIPELLFEPVPFEHPLWILYSSGTTGRPKAIVHRHGGILLEHLKVLSLHLDLQK